MFRHFIEANLGSGYDYELEVKYLLIRLGFKASLTGNDDRGVDIIAQASTPGNPKFYIQCKYHNKPVGLEAVQEVYTGCALRGSDGYPVVFTSSSITTLVVQKAHLEGAENRIDVENQKRDDKGEAEQGSVAVALFQCAFLSFLSFLWDRFFLY